MSDNHNINDMELPPSDISSEEISDGEVADKPKLKLYTNAWGVPEKPVLKRSTAVDLSPNLDTKAILCEDKIGGKYSETCPGCCNCCDFKADTGSNKNWNFSLQ